MSASRWTAGFLVCTALVAGCEKGDTIPGGAAEPGRSHYATASSLTVPVGSGVAMEFLLIRPGVFTMGSNASGDEEPPHQLTIAKPFYLAKTEVTQEQWRAVMGTNPSSHQDPKRPVENVSWSDCQDFLSKLQAKSAGPKFMLPSEAQWEYACRAGTTTRWSCGDDEDGLREFAWYSANSGDQSQPAGRKKPNAWGLFDMHGNVCEWCADTYHDDYEGAPADENAWEGSSYRVSRGGSWCHPADHARSSYRDLNVRGYRAGYLGFRPARLVATE